MIKKIFLTCLPLSMPFALISCNNQNSFYEFEKKFTEVDKVFNDYIQAKRFIPESLSKDNITKLRLKYNIGSFNDNYFKDQNLVNNNFVTIKNKKQFQNIIIDRFHELYPRAETKVTDSELKETFEKLYLGNEEVYQALENYDLYIYVDRYGYETPAQWGFKFISFIDQEKVVINTFGDKRYSIVVDLAPFAYSWGVFKVPKNKEVIFNNIDYEPRETYYSRMLSWYYNEFKKYY
ncbi:hypothetical protein [Mycoplasmopsis bovirhinis]|uniref:hypothetical protein n=1 Tax=Mycoplasmopsis bovirhinis TaxID=29553 RepID=UPI0011AE8596|nr:hypothetical protein [Mycoplasmopsis bovirhinis]